MTTIPALEDFGKAAIITLGTFCCMWTPQKAAPISGILESQSSGVDCGGATAGIGLTGAGKQKVRRSKWLVSFWDRKAVLKLGSVKTPKTGQGVRGGGRRAWRRRWSWS